MIRNVIKLAAATLLAALFMVSCENPLYDKVIADIKDPVYYTVTFDTKDGSSIPTQTILSGGVATRPANPTKGEYTFMNWYTESSCENLYDFSAKVTKSITLYALWQLGTETAPTVEIGGSSSIKITWTPPSGVYYSEILRYSTEDGTYRQIGEVKAADGVSPLPQQCVFYDYFAHSSYKYRYYIKSSKYDTASADWISHITLDSALIQGRASSGIPKITETYTVGYDSTYGVLTFNPAVKTYPYHAQAGTYYTLLVIGDGNTSMPIYCTNSFGWTNLTQYSYPSNFKSEGVELNVRLDGAYIKTDTTTTGLKSITYFDTTEMKLTGKTTGILLPSYKTRAIIFDANGGTGAMNAKLGKENSSVTLPTCTYTRDGYLFQGWSITEGGTTVDYSEGDTYSLTNEDVTLYAVWKQVGVISLNYTNTEIDTGSTLQLTATISDYGANTSFTWTSSDSSVATVTTYGLIKGISEGTATISVRNGDNTYMGSCTVTVITAYEKMTLGTTYNGEIYSSALYQIDTLSGSTYTITWYDSQYSSAYSGMIDLRPFADSNKITGLWDDYYHATSGNYAIKTFTATSSRTYLEIRPYSNLSGNRGTYKIKITVN